MDTLRNLVSHRVRFSYENGTVITGYVAACRPSHDPVRLITLTRAEVTDESGQLIEQHKELVLVPSPLVSTHIAEGPSAQQNHL